MSIIPSQSLLSSLLNSRFFLTAIPASIYLAAFWVYRKLRAPARIPYLENPFCLPLETEEPLNSQLKIKGKLTEYLQILNNNYHSSEERNNFTLYLGPSGICYMYLRLYISTRDEEQKKSYLKSAKVYLDMAEKIIEDSEIEIYPENFISLYGGPASLDALASVYYHFAGDNSKSNKRGREFTYNLDSAKLASPMPEFLHGAFGYLHGCAFLNRFKPNSVKDSDILSIIENLIACGMGEPGEEPILLWNSMTPMEIGPLHFHSNFLIHYRLLKHLWFNGEPKYYFQPVLLFSAIYLCLRPYLSENDYLGMHNGLASCLYCLLEFYDLYNKRQEWVEAIKQTIDYFLRQDLFPDFEYPMKIQNPNHQPVEYNWMYGSSGMVFLFSKAFQVLGDEKYLRAARACADNVWKKGLVKEGVGLWNGLAGNGYCFLEMYKIDQNPKYFNRAIRYAQFIWDRIEKQEKPFPYNPYSLSEGLAGVICFFNDLLNPEQSLFPTVQF